MPGLVCVNDNKESETLITANSIGSFLEKSQLKSPKHESTKVMMHSMEANSYKKWMMAHTKEISCTKHTYLTQPV
jgi:hypothetical protein